VSAIAECVPGCESTSWGVLIAPAKVPSAIIDKFNQESVRALHLPDVGERLDIAKQELAFLSKADQAWIFGETALSVYPGLRSS
jgi:tripartite-type tricarboxylate transporter receptor subunit TctC